MVHQESLAFLRNFINRRPPPLVLIVLTLTIPLTDHRHYRMIRTIELVSCQKTL